MARGPRSRRATAEQEACPIGMLLAVVIATLLAVVAPTRPSTQSAVVILIDGDRFVVSRPDRGDVGGIEVATRQSLEGAVRRLARGEVRVAQIDALAGNYGAIVAAIGSAAAAGLDDVSFVSQYAEAIDAIDAGDVPRALLTLRAFAQADAGQTDVEFLAMEIDDSIADDLQPAWRAWLTAHLRPSTRDPQTRWSQLTSLGRLGPENIDGVLDLVLGSRVDPEPAWEAMARFLRRRDTRAAAWRAVRARLPALVKLDRLGYDLIDAIAPISYELPHGACDPRMRSEVATAFTPWLETMHVDRGWFDERLAAIDACIARRSRAGDVAAALASVQ